MASTGTLFEATLKFRSSRPRPQTRSPMPKHCRGLVKKPKSMRPPACIGLPTRSAPKRIWASGKIPAVVDDSVVGSVVTSGGKSRPCRQPSSTSKRAQAMGTEHISPQSQPPPFPPHEPQPNPQAPQAPQPPNPQLPYAPPSLSNAERASVVADACPHVAQPAAGTA